MKREALTGVQKETYLTSALTRRTEAAVHFVVLTEWACVLMRAGIHTRGSTLFINHVEWALFGCEGSGNLRKVSKHQLVEVFHLSVKTADFFVHLFYFWHLPNFTIYLAQVISVFWYSLYRLIYKIQKEKEKERKNKTLPQNSEVLQLGGSPPAWEHCRENSESVLQTQKSSEWLVQPHMSCTQAWM